MAENIRENVNVDRVKKCLEQAGLMEKINSLKYGLDTKYDKTMWEDGIDLSGGEKQKLLLARALYKEASVMILDEPTAALDPIAEEEVYTKFSEIRSEGLTIYISHRLSSCKFCDSVNVFDCGTIVQKGTHDELVANKQGKYYELWNAQAQYYRNSSR